MLPLIIDKKLDFWPAMEVSRQVVHKHWWAMFLFAIVLVLIICVGALLCGVGLIIAAPVAIAAVSYVYEDLFGAAGVRRPGHHAGARPDGYGVTSNAVCTKGAS